MGLPTESSVPPITPQLVGNAFVEQYYKILHGSPELFYRFYQDGSTLSRPDSNGKMTSVTTTQGINDFILSLDCKNYIIEILTTDAQPSYKGGVFIQVTGCMIGLDNIRRRFSQSFFLVLQDCGVYFVLNDVFRFVDDYQPAEVNQMLANRVSDAQISPLTHEQVQNLHATNPPTPLSESLHDSKESCDVTENGGSLVEEDDTVDQPAQPIHIEKGRVIEVLDTVEQKKSYASILAKGSTPPMPALVPTTKARSAPTYHEKPPLPPTTPAHAPEITSSSSNGTSDANCVHEEEGYSIFIRNLPLNVTALQVEEVFKKFGPIKPQGVQVRSHKDRNCFGFVEFESLDSKQAAIEATPVMIEGRQVFIAEKKTTKRVNGVVSTVSNGNGTTRQNFGGGGRSNGSLFRNDHFRGGRASFGGNQGGFARNEFRISRGGGDYSGRGRGPPRGWAPRVRPSEVYQPRAVQNGYAKTGHPTFTNEATNEAAVAA